MRLKCIEQHGQRLLGCAGATLPCGLGTGPFHSTLRGPQRGSQGSKDFRGYPRAETSGSGRSGRVNAHLSFEGQE